MQKQRMNSLKKLNFGIVLVCLIGIAISYYAYVVEINKERNKNYEAMCDISEHMSCSKAFMSDFGKGFGILRHITGENSVLNQPNSVYGMIFYTIVIGLCAVNSLPVAKLQVFLCVISNIGSVYLAYILYFVLYDLCIVCVSTYAVNLINLVLSVLRMKAIHFLQENITSRNGTKRKAD